MSIRFFGFIMTDFSNDNCNLSSARAIKLQKLPGINENTNQKVISAMEVDNYLFIRNQFLYF